MDNKKLLILVDKYTSIANETIHMFEKIGDNGITIDDVEESLYNALGYIGICLDKFKYPENEKKFCSGFKFICNTIKHSKDPFELNFLNYGKSSYIGLAKVGYMRLGMGPAIEWNDLPLNKKAYLNQYTNFQNTLLNKEVIPTLKAILEIISTQLIETDK